MKIKSFAMGTFLLWVSGVSYAVLIDSVSQYGITWTFDKNYEVGQFANGDYWVLAPTNQPVVITSITPDFDGQKNGWEVNPAAGGIVRTMTQGFDSMTPAFNASLVPTLPYTASAGQSIVKSIHAACAPDCKNTTSVLQTAAVLTVLGSVPPDNGATVFRPPYVGTDKPLYRTTSLRTNLIPSLPMISGAPTLDSIFKRFQRVQLDHFFPQSSSWRNLHPLDNMPDYGGDIGRRNSDILRLLLNDPIQDKMPLLKAYVQYGIDMLHMSALGQTWVIGGSGHKPGQMLPLAFAAIMLDDPQLKTVMQSVSASRIEENISTYVNAAGVTLFGQEEGTGPTAEKHYWDSVATAQGFKTRKDPYQYVDGGYNPGTSYQAIIAPIFRSEVLAADLMPELKTVWNNPEFFEYVHRSSNLGAWSQPDPCAPYDGNMANYGITFGPDGNGSCIQDTNASDGIGRFPSRHGVPFMAVAYRTPFQDAMWNAYQVPLDSNPPPGGGGNPGGGNPGGGNPNTPGLVPNASFGNFKNIFNPTKDAPLTIQYSASGNDITLTVYDRKGDELQTLERGSQTNGVYSTTWDGRNNSGSVVAAGTYVLVLKQGGVVQKKKVVVIK